MERLTVADVKIDGGVRRAVIDTRAVKENAMTIYWALKKYEDTGLTPTEIIRKHMNDKAADGGWIPVEEQLPEEKINPVSQDFCEYQVTVKFGNTVDVRYYKYGHGHWWHGAGIVDKYVIAWRENPEPYRQKN